MAHLLFSLAIQDGKIDDNEIAVIQDVLQADNDLLRTSAQVDIADAINTVKEMHITQKMKFAEIVLKVAEADGFVHPKEKALASSYFELTGIAEFSRAVDKYNAALKNSQYK